METIIPDTLNDWLKNKKVILVDVREPAEHKAESIDGAHLIPLSEFSVKKLPSTEKPVVVHCQSGKRSLKACEKLLKENPSIKIYSLEGGIIAWKKSGLKVNRSGNFIPVERQQQIVAGSLILSGLALGIFINPAFNLIPALAGSGLIISGFTGYCGMVKIIAKMPWNK